VIGGGFVAYRHFNRPPLPDQLPGQADVFAQGQAYDNTLHIQQGHECFNEVYVTGKRPSAVVVFSAMALE